MAKLQRWAPLLPMIKRHFPPALLGFLVEIVPWKALHEFKTIIDTMERNSAGIMGELKSSLAESGAVDDEGVDITSVFRA
jgi:hypothetical protein